jgi:hypothetical protein
LRLTTIFQAFTDSGHALMFTVRISTVRVVVAPDVLWMIGQRVEFRSDPIDELIQNLQERDRRERLPENGLVQTGC